jgi:hypothetical protein
MMWIEIDGDYYNAELIAAVRHVSKSKCAIFFSNSSPVDGGFLIDLPISSVLALLREARFSELAEMIAAQAGDEPPARSQDESGSDA